MSEFYWVVIALVSVVSVARITRLFTYDDFPPLKWIRVQWVKAFPEGSDWATLWVCPYCFSMYAAAFVLGWGYLSHWDLYWWLFNGWMAMSYAAAILMVRDGED